MNHHPQIDLDPAEPRCLGKTPEGKPNGCAMAYQCKRHLAIRSDPYDGIRITANRACQPTVFNAYLPVDRDSEKTCSYPKCDCPFDAPADPNWCARGYPKPSHVCDSEGGEA